MTDRGTDSIHDNGDRLAINPDSNDDLRRLGNPTRLVPRQPPPEDSLTVSPYPAEFEDEVDPRRPSSPFGQGGLGGSMFGPRSFGNGRVQVWGCSPGCLIASLVASAVLTLLLNAIF